jgi:hypothetical protein
MKSWWNTTGATILITGVVSIVSLMAGSLLRPWVERRVTRQRGREEMIQSAKELAMDLTALLMRGFGGGGPPDLRAKALADWRETIGRRALSIATFIQPEATRNRARRVWLEFERVAVQIGLIEVRGQAPLFGTEEGLTFDEDVSEAAFALEQFIESIGGPKAKTRDQFPLILRDDDSEPPEPIIPGP